MRRAGGKEACASYALGFRTVNFCSLVLLAAHRLGIVALADHSRHVVVKPLTEHGPQHVLDAVLQRLACGVRMCIDAVGLGRDGLGRKFWLRL